MAIINIFDKINTVTLLKMYAGETKQLVKRVEVLIIYV